MTDPGPGASSEVSVVVATYARPEGLARLLEALERQSLAADRFDVVICDDASPATDRRRNEQAAERSALHVTYLLQPRNAGPAAARNAGWRAALSPVIAFTDDDCVPSERWLEEGLRALQAGPRVVIGQVRPDPARLTSLGPFSRSMWVSDARFFQTCNAFYHREDLLAVGGFDETFPGAAGEDTDLGLRVTALGGAAAFAAEALVHHDVAEGSLAQRVRDNVQRWPSVVRVVAKHPASRRTLLHRRIFWKRSHPPFLLACAGLLGTAQWPIAGLLVLPWLRFRLMQEPMSGGLRMRLVLLPAAFAVDGSEVIAMVRGSLRHKAVVL